MDEYVIKGIVKRLKTSRQERKLTQAELAERVGIEPNSLANIESGHRLFSVDLLLRLMDELDISADYILKGYTKADNSPIMEIMKSLNPKDFARAEEILRLFAESANEKHK